jgi:uncharacterized protein
MHNDKSDPYIAPIFFNRKIRRNARLLLRLTALFCLASTVNAASFDCEKSVTSVEKSICLNRELSELDEVLNVAYRRGLGISLNEKELKESQQKWLIRRNNCVNENCLADLYRSRIEWLSMQPRAAMKYKLVMSMDDSVCSQALDSFNNHLEEEYPPQPPAFIPTNYRKHAPAEVSPQWRKIGDSSTWVTEVDLDWDGKLQTILKDSRVDSGEKKSIFLDVFYDIELNFPLDKYNIVNMPNNHIKTSFI